MVKPYDEASVTKPTAENTNAYIVYAVTGGNIDMVKVVR